MSLALARLPVLALAAVLFAAPIGARAESSPEAPLGKSCGFGKLRRNRAAYDFLDKLRTDIRAVLPKELTRSKDFDKDSFDKFRQGPVMAFWSELAAQKTRLTLGMTLKKGEPQIFTGRVKFLGDEGMLRLDGGKYDGPDTPFDAVTSITVHSDLDHRRLAPIRAEDVRFRKLQTSSLIKQAGIAKDIVKLQHEGARITTPDRLLAKGVPESTADALLLGMDLDNVEKPDAIEATYSAFSRVLKAEEFEKAYARFGIGLDDDHHTEKFLTAVEKGGGQIYFLIPSENFSKRNTITRMEYLWLLDHPHVLKRTTFILGAYDHLDPAFAKGRAFRIHPEWSGALESALRDYGRHL